MNTEKKNKPVIYACAGCSGAGQVAYKIALALDKKGIAEMSCLAGLASKQKTFINKIKNRDLWIADGCTIECSKSIFNNMNLSETKHIRLHKLGIKKNIDPNKIDIERIIEEIIENNSDSI